MEQGAAWAGLVLAVALAWELLWFALAKLLKSPTWSRRLRPVPALAGLGLVAWGLVVPPPQGLDPAPAAQGPDIVLITLDTFRADLYPAYTPRLEQLAKGGIRYTQAVSTAPLTGPAHASMLSGLEVQDHGLLANGRSLDVPTVVPELQAAGYATGAFLAAQVLDRSTGLQAGFEHYDDRWGPVQRLQWHPFVELLDLRGRGTQRSGVKVIERALAWKAAQDRPVFLWIHLYDAHAPYGQPKGHGPTVEELEQARHADEAALRGRKGMQSLMDFLNSSRPNEQVLRYRAGGRYTDQLVGTALDDLDEDAWVFVVGDHGESLTEHDYPFNHGRLLYEPSLHVPFVVAHPSLEPRVEERLASVTQVADWLRAASGLGEAPQPISQVWAYTTGQQAHGTAIKPRDRKLEHRRAAALRLDGQKLVLHPERPSGEWFDLRIDPFELDPQPVPEVLRDELDELREMVAQKPASLDEAQQRRLEALGYLE